MRISLMFLMCAACAPHLEIEEVTLLKPSPPPELPPQAISCGEPVLVAESNFSFYFGSYQVVNGRLEQASCEKTGKPVLLELLVRPYYLDRTEVTHACYRKCVDEGVCSPPAWDASDPDSSDWKEPHRDQRPIGGVTYTQSAVYCSWRGGRLPSRGELLSTIYRGREELEIFPLTQELLACIPQGNSTICQGILHQGKILYPTTADKNPLIPDIMSWSSKDVGRAGIRDVFGGIAERTSTRTTRTSACNTNGPVADIFEEKLEPGEESYHAVVSIAGALRGVLEPDEDGPRFGNVGFTSRSDHLRSYALGFRCAFGSR